ncbi:FeoB-associated Cys-rich membrane protein [Sphingobacterium lactis]
MNLTIQYIIVAILFIGAVYYIAKPFFSKNKKSPGCSRCGSCETSTDKK